MRRILKWALPGIALLAAGWGLGRLQPVPVAADGARRAAMDWSLPPLLSLDLRAADRVWVDQGPWGLPPPPPPPAPPPPTPQPRPIGVVATPGRPEVLFLLPEGGEAQVAVGRTIPGGGRVLAIRRFRIEWVDRDGKRQQHELFANAAAGSAPSP